MLRLFFNLFFLLACLSIFANDVDSISGKEYHLSGVEITSSIPSVVRASSPLQVVTAESISKLGIGSVSDAVRHFTGVAVKDYGGLGGLKTVSVRGFGAQHTTVSYDGITLNNAQAGQIDLSKLSLNNVSSIALSLGLEDIFQPARNVSSIALLNIETKAPELTDKPFKGEFLVKTGSFGLFESSLNYLQKLNNKLVLIANIDGVRSDGKFPFELRNGQETSTLKRNNNAVKDLHGELNLYANISPTDELKVKVYYYDSKRGVPGPVILYNSYSVEKLWNDNASGQISYRKIFSDKFNYKVLAKYNYDYMKYQDWHDTKYPPNGTIINEFRQNEYYLSNIFLYKISDRISMSLAQDLSYSKLKNNSVTIDILKNPERRMSITNLAFKYDDKRLLVVGNIYGTISQDKVKKAEKNNYKRLSPSLSMSYALLENKSLRLRASYRDIFRVPTISEEYYKLVGTPLKPEKIRQFNLGIVWSSQISERIEYIRLIADVYHANVKDKIVIIPKPIFSQTSNRGKVRMNGADLNLATNIRVNNDLSFEIAGGYSFLSAVDMKKTTIEEDNKAYKDQIEYTPKHSGSASVVFDNPWLNIGYSVIVSGDRYVAPQNIPANHLDGYTDHTLSVNKQFILKGTSISMQADLRNIFDENYSIIQWYPMQGRSFTVSAKIKF